MLNDFIEAVVGSADETTTHSLKSTTLVWAARYGMDDKSRCLLGHHTTKENSLACYSRCWRSLSATCVGCSSMSVSKSSTLMEPVRDGWRRLRQVLESDLSRPKMQLVKGFRAAKQWRSQQVLLTAYLHLWLWQPQWQRWRMRKRSLSSKNVLSKMISLTASSSLLELCEILETSTLTPQIPLVSLSGAILSKMMPSLTLETLDPTVEKTSMSVTPLGLMAKKWSRVQVQKTRKAMRVPAMKGTKKSFTTARSVMECWKESRQWRATSCKTSAVACCTFVVKIQRTICNQWRLVASMEMGFSSCVMGQSLSGPCVANVSKTTNAKRAW